MTPQQWLLSERDYETGRRIYEALGANTHLKRTLSAGPNAYNREAVAYELGKLAKAGVAEDVLPALAVDYLPQLRKQLPDAAFRQQVLNAPEPELPAPDPEQERLLQELKAQRPRLYDERRHLHAQLELLPTDADRLQAALRIQALSRQIDENWRRTAYVREHGLLPIPAPAAPVVDVQQASLADLLSRRANLRSNISKWKKKPARATELAAALTEAAMLTARIDELKGEEVRRG